MKVTRNGKGIRERLSLLSPDVSIVETEEIVREEIEVKEQKRVSDWE